MERLLSRDCEAIVQTRGPRRTHQIAGDLLDRVSPDFLHVFHDAGILLHALLSGTGIAARLSDGHGWKLDTTRFARTLGHHSLCGYRLHSHSYLCAKSS